MIVGRSCVRKPGAWAEKPHCDHFARRTYFAAWWDKFGRDERLLEHIPLCAECYGEYVQKVNDKLEKRYREAERAAERVFELSEVLKRCGPMFCAATA